MQSSYSVVICGAGPTGLMLAAQLLRFQIPFLIIDTKAGPTNESRAVVVQARSLEVYEQMGLSDEILANAKKVSGICFWHKGKKMSEIALKNFGANITPFDFVVMYEQSKNETLLYQFLLKHDADVLWNTEAVSYEITNGNYEVKLKTGEKETTITTQYLIACDGAKSTLRELAQMDFKGGSYQQVFYVADTHVGADVCASHLNFFLAKSTFHLLFPMQGEKRFRAIGILPQQFYHQSDISFDEVSGQVDADANINLNFYGTQWYSTYRLHHKKVKAFNVGNLFFCGDAAHVHSPAGGQGMNTGLQDAYNLAWKLALVINKEAKPELLATYHEERNPVAERLLKTTDRMFSYMSKNSFLNKLLRLYVVPFVLPTIMKIQSIRRSVFIMVSQTKISYRKSSLSSGKNGKIKSGQRLPYTTLLINKQEQSLFQFVRTKANTPFVLLYFNVRIQDNKPNDLISFAEIENNPFNAAALRKIGFASSFVLLLRPDNYIGYMGETYDTVKLNAYLRNNLMIV